jgi:tetratricopeptide (TPR) repeat protein
MNERKKTKKENSIISLMLKYDIYNQKHDFNNALKVAEELVNLRGNAEDWLRHGVCHMAHGNAEEALVSFRQAADLDPENDITWTNLGVLLYQIGFYERALKTLEYALLLNPDNLEALFNKGTILNNLGIHDEALIILNQVIEIKPDFQIARKNRGLALSNLRRYEEAWKSLDEAIRLDASDVIALENKGYVLVNLERYAEALTIYAQVIELNPINAEAWLGYGISLTNLGRFDEALNSLTKVIELESNNTRAWYGMSLVLRELERYEEALSACEKSIELSRKTASVLLNKAVILLVLNRWTEGLMILNDALNTLNQNEDAPHSRDMEIIISSLLLQSQEKDICKIYIKGLMEIYERHQFTALLEQELIQSLAKVFSSHFNLKRAKIWREIWTELASNCTQFQKFLRLLDAVVRYRQTKGDPFILLELSIENSELYDLFLSLMGVEKKMNQLDQKELVIKAGLLALTSYKFFGKGVVYFDGEKPRFRKRDENMYPKLLALVDDYEPENEFLIIPSNHQLANLVEFSDIGLASNPEVEEVEYERELDSLLAQAKEQGLTSKQIAYLRKTTLAYRDGAYNQTVYPPEILEIIPTLLEVGINGNIQALVDFSKNFL